MQAAEDTAQAGDRGGVVEIFFSPTPALDEAGNHMALRVGMNSTGAIPAPAAATGTGDLFFAPDAQEMGGFRSSAQQIFVSVHADAVVIVVQTDHPLQRDGLKFQPRIERGGHLQGLPGVRRVRGTWFASVKNPFGMILHSWSFVE